MLIEIPIELVKLEEGSYHIMLTALFNNQFKGSLIIDTGASKTVFDIGFTKDLISDSVIADNHKSSGINAAINEALIGTIPEISIGTLKIKNHKSLLLDLSHINKIYSQYSSKHIAGLIGSDFLLKHNAIIDYNTKNLTLQL